MPLWPEFVGGAYLARSRSIAAETCINLYPETRDVPGSPKQHTLYGTPGTVRILTADRSIERGLFHQDGRTFTVVGNTFYEVDIAAATTTTYGTIPEDGFPVSFASNGAGGEQLGIVGGGELHVFDLVTNTLSAAIVLPFPDPVMLVFIDGYGLINQRDTPIVWFSALEDLESWDALDFFVRSGTSDHFVGLAVTRDRVWALGSATSTPYYDSGDADNPFLPYPGTVMQVGLVSPWALQVHKDVVYWLATGKDSAYTVVRASDSSPQPISTPPIETWLAGCTTLADAEMLCYEQEGHTFVLLTCPSSPDAVQTYGFDARENLWHARAGCDSVTGEYTRWRARGVVAVDGQIYVGDYANGKIYRLSLDAYDDDGAVLRAERTAPYLSVENQWLFLRAFELGTQPGMGLASGQGSEPMVTLEISRDSTATWVMAGDAPLGEMGEYDTRSIWRRLGRTRADQLVVRVTQTDPVKRVWGPGAWLRVARGTGQL